MPGTFTPGKDKKKMEYLTLKEVAAALGISIMGVYRLHYKGAIPFTKIGKATRIQRAALEQYLTAQTN